MILISKKTLIISITLIALAGFGAWFVYQYKQELENRVRSLPKSEQELNLTLTPVTSTLKTYRNEQFGFEFQYPEGWSFHENTFGGPFSKFNLVGAALEENGRPNPIFPSLLVNIVTPDFVERQFADLKNIATKISVGGVDGEKYEYTDQVAEVVIILPFRQYKMILNAKKEHEDIFNQILASFKFLK